MSSTHPYYRKRPPGPFHVIRNFSDGTYVDLRYVRLPFYGAELNVTEAVRRFDARTAECARTSLGDVPAVAVFPKDTVPSLLKKEHYFGRDVFIPEVRTLAALAYLEFFPYDRTAQRLRGMVSEAIRHARPGYCGTFGRSSDLIDAATHAPLYGSVAELASGEGNYDLSQMHLLQIAYRYYDDLTPEAREHLIQELLANGTIHRPSEDDLRTSGYAPEDWARAGYVIIPPEPTLIPPLFPDPFDYGTKVRIGETENHILQIHTVRYLTNQLLYQRHHHPNHDNRRNNSHGAPSCTDLMLRLLRNFLRDDFSEYNAKPYQTETRNALRNLCSYAYDHEVRLAARMVLDYVSAHVAVSSCDLRRLVPFRRINEGEKAKLIRGSTFMDVGLLDWSEGADRAAEPFAVQSGNLRAYRANPVIEPKRRSWLISSAGKDGLMEGLGDYRIPPSIHELFVNDSKRRFFQRLHRTKQGDVESGQNADNMEIYAGSPSYLITAGGSPAGVAIDPGQAAIVKPSLRTKQLGVAVTTSFMPAGQAAGENTQFYARDQIQFSSFAQEGPVENYGVAPDFACGHQVHLPQWFFVDLQLGNFSFVNKGGASNDPGFFLALLRDGDYAVMEAHDTLLYPDLEFCTFCDDVFAKNATLKLGNHKESYYTMTNGNRVHFVIWNAKISFGARVRRIEYPPVNKSHPNDLIGDAANNTGPFVNGTIMNSRAEAVVEITTPGSGTLILDMNDPKHPKRTSERGEFEEAGAQNEVWVDFAWGGQEEGDFFHPFRTVAAAAAAVADGGVIKIVPGSTEERVHLAGRKRMRLEAAIGGVRIGVRPFIPSGPPLPHSPLPHRVG